MGQKVSLGRKFGGHGSYSRLSGGENLSGTPAQPPAKSQVCKLVFTEGCGYEFDLEDMLRASAEVLGKGSFGTSYKASLEDGPTVAVKRLKMGTLGRNPATVITDFKNLVEKCSSIRHENVATLRAYLTDKEEQLLVYDYYGRGSMSSLLHGKEGVVMTPMAWEDRLNMAIGAARGLAYIHSQEGGKLVHGNLKPSNIFLGSHGYGFVSDILFTSLMNYVQQQQPIITKYQAPEVAENRRSQESDVYSFGVLLLELLVRKFEPAPSNGEVSEYVRWGQIVSREVESGEVFDAPLRDQASILKELQEAFHIGIQCVQKLPEERPKMPDVLERLEGIRGQRTEK